MADKVAPHPIALLTGAGFTNAVNAYLTLQIWEHAFNQAEVASDDILRREMLNNGHDLNYEIIYEVLQKTRGYEKAFAHYLTALDRVFAQIDDIVRASLVGEAGTHRVNVGTLYEWLGSFRHRKGGQGFIFTLNHDLFLERLLGRRDGAPKLPGIPDNGQAEAVAKTTNLEKLKIPKDASQEAVLKALTDFNLIKLHGSSNWTYEDGTTTMITGPRKHDAIKEHPLLSAYSKIFTSVLESCQQLWVIGYGFGDKNVNDAIIRGVKKGLAVYIVDMALPKDLLNNISGRCGEIRPAVRGYVRNSLAGIFPRGETSSIPFAEIKSLMPPLQTSPH